MFDIPLKIDCARIEEAIEALKQYVNDSSIEPLIAALEALKEDPDNESHLAVLVAAFAALGIVQGAVLTYAPYVSTLVSPDLLEDF